MQKGSINSGSFSSFRKIKLKQSKLNGKHNIFEASCISEMSLTSEQNIFPGFIWGEKKVESSKSKGGESFWLLLNIS